MDALPFPAPVPLYATTDETGWSLHDETGRWRAGEWRTLAPDPAAPLRLAPSSLAASLADPELRRGLTLAGLARELGDGHGLVAEDPDRRLSLADWRRLPLWIGPVFWWVETAGELLESGGRLRAREARLLLPVALWDDEMARRFARECAERVLAHFEAVCPGEPAPRLALLAARAGSPPALSRAAADAARVAAEAAIERSVPARDRIAAWHAAWAASRAAAPGPGWRAARDAAWAAARAADGSAAALLPGSAERAWQAEHLAGLLGLVRDASR